MTDEASSKPGRRRSRPSTAQRQELPWLVEALKLLVTGAIAAVATIVVGYFTFFNTGRELDIRMVELSLSILAGEKGGVEQTPGGSDHDEYLISRLFALRALSKFSGVSLSESEMLDWARSGSVSFGTVPSAFQNLTTRDDLCATPRADLEAATRAGDIMASDMLRMHIAFCNEIGTTP